MLRPSSSDTSLQVDGDTSVDGDTHDKNNPKTGDPLARRPDSRKVGNRNRYSSPVRRAKRPRSFVVRALGHDGDEVLSRREKMPLPLKATTSGRQDLLLQTF